MKRSIFLLKFKPYLLAVAAVAAAIVINLLLQRWHIDPANFALVFLTVVLVTAVIYGLGPALFASVISLLAYNFFFFPPLFTFTIDDASNVVTLFFFGIVAVIASNLAARVRRHAVVAETERLRSAMLTSLSHDLRTPLASILGAASTLTTSRDALDEVARDDLIGTVRDEAERLHRFISNLLDMTRLESGAVAPNSELVDLSDIVGTALRRADEILSSHEVKIDIPADLPLVQLDPVLFEQVIFNLLDNAAKYSPPHSCILVRAREDPSVVRMEIADEGQGIPAEETERIFEKFYRARAGDRQRAGTGLGLAICRGFLQAMKCTVVAGNRTDRRGAVFTLTLPTPAQPRELSTE
jgi:two-component system sensor histidine kinase KdpD